VTEAAIRLDAIMAGHRKAGLAALIAQPDLRRLA
jgi:hypothetical protein